MTRARIESRHISVTIDFDEDPDADTEDIDIHAVADVLYAAVIGIGFNHELASSIIKSERGVT